ncbi:hypothetical protein DFH29DRAFT_1005565 [Suillus ampliporus]|nr:hypothetical protein DFH29DRAFT_1005565 [Suillus ampliporus]
MAFSFAALSAPPILSMKDRITADWTFLEEKMMAEAKCIPDDKVELQEEILEWCQRWAALLGDFTSCRVRGEEHDLSLGMSAEATAVGNDANAQFERWECAQVAQEARAKDHTSREVQMAAVSPPRARTKSVLTAPSAADDVGDAGSSASKAGRKQMEVSVPPVTGARLTKTIHIVHNPPCARTGKKCEGEKSRTCGPCGAVRQKCEYSSGGKIGGEDDFSADAPTPAAGGGGSICKSVSAPALADVAASEPEIVETAPSKRAPRLTCKAAAASKGKGKAKAKQAAPVEPAPPTVVDSSDDGASYTRGEIGKIQHDMRVLKGQLLGLYESAYKMSNERVSSVLCTTNASIISAVASACNICDFDPSLSLS